MIVTPPTAPSLLQVCPIHALERLGACETVAYALTRAIACIFMPLEQLRVMEVSSFALTPSGPPICSTASHKSLPDLEGLQAQIQLCETS